jgi:hypothetical protein
MRTARAIKSTAAIGVAVLLASVIAAGCTPSQGPVGNPHSNLLAFSVPADKPFTYGLAIVWNKGETPAVLESVEMIEATPGFEVVKQKVAGETRKFSISGERTYPPRQPRELEPLSGYVLQPEAAGKAGKLGGELILKLRTAGPGIYRFRGLRLTYRVGSERYSAVIPHELRACAISSHEGRGVREWPQCLARREYT